MRALTLDRVAPSNTVFDRGPSPTEKKFVGLLFKSVGCQRSRPSNQHGPRTSLKVANGTSCRPHNGNLLSFFFFFLADTCNISVRSDEQLALRGTANLHNVIDESARAFNVRPFRSLCLSQYEDDNIARFDTVRETVMMFFSTASSTVSGKSHDTTPYF